MWLTVKQEEPVRGVSRSVRRTAAPNWPLPASSVTGVVLALSMPTMGSRKLDPARFMILSLRCDLLLGPMTGELGGRLVVWLIRTVGQDDLAQVVRIDFLAAGDWVVLHDTIAQSGAIRSYLLTCLEKWQSFRPHGAKTERFRLVRPEGPFPGCVLE